MFTRFTGSGGLGDSVIISTKLINICMGNHTSNDTVLYTHLESDKRENYKTALYEYWELVKNKFNEFFNFNYEIRFYKHGDFWNVVPRCVFNTATGLTTAVDALCKHAPISLVDLDETYFNTLCVVTDGGNGARTISPSVINALSKQYEVVAIGAKRMQNLTCVNYTGHTTLTEALQIVSSSQAVIGPDGILTYFAAAYDVPTAIIYHAANLVNDYAFNKLPNRKIKALVLPAGTKEWSDVEKTIEVAKYLL